MNLFAVQEYMQHYGDELKEAVNRVLEHGQYILGPEVATLEQLLEAYVGVPCVTVGNGTDALFIALKVLGIGGSDEVITPSFTWVSPAEAIIQCGAVPVYVDIDPYSFTLNPALIEAAITERTKAIMPVSLFGQMSDLSAINEIAKRYNLAVIEDGAQSFGASHGSVKSGGQSTIATTSFFPTKPLSCFGDGGALFTRDRELHKRIIQFRSHGQSHTQVFDFPGVNSRLDTLQAAVLLVKLKYIDQELRARLRIASVYNDTLCDLVEVPHVLSTNVHAYALYTIQTDARDQLLSFLRSQDIPVGVYYSNPLHHQKIGAYSRYSEVSLSETERVSRRVLSLPMHPFLTEADQQVIISAITDFFS